MDATVLDSFLLYMGKQDQAPLTIKGYRSDLEQFARWFERTNNETLTPQRVTPTDVRQYRQQLLMVEKRKASTVNRRLAALTAFLEWAVKTGQIDHNPAREIKHVPQIPSGPKYLGKREQYALQRVLEKDVQLSRLRFPKRWRARQRDASLTIFLIHTGLRLQEALDLCLEDMQLSERKGQIIVRHGKGGKQRVVPLNGEARKALQEWLAVRTANADCSHVWVAVEAETSGALSNRSVQRVLQRYGQEAGLEQLTPHMLRHTFGKNLVDSGVGLEKVAALLGHANLNTTRLYITPNHHDLEEAVEQISNQS